MEQQLVDAVRVAADPAGVGAGDPALRAQALAFLSDVQARPHAAWPAAWSVFAADPPHDPTTRIFALSLVTAFLANAPPGSPDAAGLPMPLLAHVHTTYALRGGESDPALASKLAQTITQLLTHLYTQPEAPSLLIDLFSLVRTSPTAPLNVPVADLVLRVLHDLSLTLGSDVAIRAAKDRRTLSRDGQVKDAIRAHHASALAEQVWSIASDCLAALAPTPTQPPQPSTTAGNGLDQATATALLRQALLCAGDYASWLDISLMVTPQTVDLLMRALHLPSPAVRGAAADALLEVVLKGMKPTDKQQLLSLFGLTSILAQQERSTRSSGTHTRILALHLDPQTSDSFSPSPTAEEESNVEFREKIAKLVDGIASELVKVIDETGPVQGAASSADDLSFFGHTRQAAIGMLNNHLALVLCFLADEQEGPSEHVLPSIHAILAMYKKAKRRTPEGVPTSHQPLPQPGFLTSLLAVVGQKLKYAPDQPWTGLGSEEDTPQAATQDDDAPDSDEAAFVQVRKKLQQVATAVAGLDEPLFAASMQRVIVDTLARYEQSIASNGATPLPSWQEIEVALFCTYIFGEILSTTGSSPLKAGLTTFAFVDTTGLPVIAPGAKRGVQPKVSGEQLRTLPLNLLGETVQRVLASGVAAFPHPAVQLQLFETLVRYSTFFAVRPGLLQDALAYFLDARGIHRPEPGFRRRANYLFGRFVRETRTHIVPDMVPPMLENMQDVLRVQADVLPPVPQGEDPFERATNSSAFDSQLHLFNAAGILLASLHHDPERQAALLAAVVAPLAQGLTDAVQAFDASGRTELRLVLQVHHLILAMSTLAKGFPDAPTTNQDSPGTCPLWVEAFKRMTEHIMTSVAALRDFRIVREAGRGAFARIINTIGRHALPFVPILIEAVLNELSPVELVESLNFISMLTNKYRSDVQATLDNLLLGLLQRTFVFLNQPVTGTDESLERTLLQKAYIGLIHSLVSSGLDSVLLSPQNQAQLQPILESLTYYAGNAPDKATQRSAVNCLTAIVTVWGQNVPGFESFLYERIVPLSFEAMAKPGFDLNDAQAQQVLTELALLIKRAHMARGDELTTFLLAQYFPSIHCPAQLASEMAEGVKSLDPKAFRRLLLHFAQASRAEGA